MAKENYMINRKKRILFYILMAAVLCWFVVLQIFGTNERDKKTIEQNILYQGTFVWEKSDGSREQIEVPGKYELSAKETMVLVTQLPEDYDEKALAIRSSLQEVRFYVDGVLRAEYDTSDTRLAGKNSASRYVFCPTTEADVGKEVRIELKTNTAKYSGVVNAVYCGDKAEIWEYIFAEHGLETVIAFFILFAGIVTVIFSIALGVVYRTKFDMEYLGWCMIMAAGWMVGESKLRQVLVPNATVLATLCFVMIMLGPLPIIYYIDSMQSGRHQKLFWIAEAAAIVNFAVCTILHLSGAKDYIETLPIAHVILAVTLVLILGTVFYDMYHGYITQNRFMVVGLLIAVVSVVVESISAYFVISISGIFMGIGMIVLLFFSLVRTIRNLQKMESRRQRQEMRKRRKQMETMSLQMMQTLSTTIEAKDEYTRGHSHRVAEYAVLIAKELGWSQKDISNLRNAAHLHDIGKIGIPDTILNKPTKLTEEEYAVIKEHTVIGAEILKNIRLIDHVTEVARSHHERYDGTGYPDGLKGEEIPIHARIIAVADSYDAMQSRRIYRNPLGTAVIYNEILNNRGTQFDPEIADVFLKLLDENRLVINADYKGIEDEYALPAVESEIEKFISNVMTTMRTQEDSEGFDFLTGLPMRNRGEKLAAQFMQQDDGYLVFLDMDNLKKINDIYGHKAGDRALKLLGSLLLEFAQHSVVCRLGGDEFLMFVPNVSKEKISEIVRSILQKFEEQKEEDMEIRHASISAGICETTKGASFEECYTKADKALYYVKQNGKGDFFFYQQMEQEQKTDQGTGRDLAMIIKALRESGNYTGALDLDYREFAKIYEYMNHLGERYKYHCYLVMVTMDTTPDYVMYIENIERALESMEQAIRQTIRKVDICTRYSSMQYLIILFEADETKIPKVMDRIFTQYYKQYDKSNFIPKYEYILIMEEKEEQ